MTVREIARLVGGEIVGDPDVVITDVSGIKEAKKGSITFVANPKYLVLLKSTQASAVIISESNHYAVNSNLTLIKVENPTLAFSKIIELIGPEPVKFKPGIHPTAVIGENVKLGKDVSIQPYTVVEDNVVIGDRTVIGACGYIGHCTKIGSDCFIYPHVIIRERIIIGNRVNIHSGTVIGGDGFGFATVKGVHHKIPQIGIVEIGNDVEIGSNVTIDRARFEKTYIGNGVKIDNLVQIAHNVIIGDNTIIVAQVGVSGSARIGKNVVIAGQAGLIGHIEVGDNAIIGGRAGVTKNVPANSNVSGFPAREKWEDMKCAAYLRKSPEIFAKIKRLEDRISQMEKKLQKYKDEAEDH
ncbi:MAG: UDP-3-O-acylglucosamine N-acyltransferase [candidate division TA06 bacterium ADurb.Bin131]|jgi:UDP-3-O-[3-hydroxymyristoyl] glucosamine N-acyltransferase|uniref:UDP-3-O-acylglucosamine N-acyltransferase n=1 Tax=candidate division TA06 bacterium ADurb.Bin131 TaxID=1852827 RepID=A0A1V6CD73_UNCT6|nr:MAG: UDP-3-O-acylglucosamine N-acyltransferase [candidate division TA06 bacterium ADurb.Bin131]HOC03128.1 UDP-3-O-(3-hydroxymyristoyl)glucosamine N-acyltransferase [bacterium]HON05564.1 UDP-3-O-(3-hydroxymyristoyl)glucosamine N-acyltransferase [bacterium]HPC29406.1 UDP-3-O-(3-hydroxymyristoyl)glucosamine N-acyltransferase [bacterium]HQL64785.1 UDP-3-O-(3-hydroxymyristoyl)glucosamine N-acyltransferase [bacterium]